MQTRGNWSQQQQHHQQQHCAAATATSLSVGRNDGFFPPEGVVRPSVRPSIRRASQQITMIDKFTASVSSDDVAAAAAAAAAAGAAG